jgi:predicted RNase H-like HicB family nuclease
MNKKYIEVVQAVLNKIEELLQEVAEFYAGQSFEDIKAEYKETLQGAMEDYLRSGKPITSFRNEFRRAVNDAFTLTFYAGWADAGASGPITDAAQSWLNGRISQEIQFADTLFSELPALRNSTEIPMSAKLEATEQHATAYANTLTGVYAYGKMMGEPERDAIWRLGKTEAHCNTCSTLNGQKHPISWFIDHGYIPQEPGSSTLDCGGWNCDCSLNDPKTGEQLIP